MPRFKENCNKCPSTSFIYIFFNWSFKTNKILIEKSKAKKDNYFKKSWKSTKTQKVVIFVPTSMFMFYNQ